MEYKKLSKTLILLQNLLVHQLQFASIPLERPGQDPPNRRNFAVKRMNQRPTFRFWANVFPSVETELPCLARRAETKVGSARKIIFKLFPSRIHLRRKPFRKLASSYPSGRWRPASGTEERDREREREREREKHSTQTEGKLESSRWLGKRRKDITAIAGGFQEGVEWMRILQSGPGSISPRLRVDTPWSRNFHYLYTQRCASVRLIWEG